MSETDSPTGKYSWIQPEILGLLDDEEFAGVSAYREGLRPIIDRSMEEFARLGDVITGEFAFRDEQTGLLMRMDPETGELTIIPEDSDGNPIDVDDDGGGSRRTGNATAVGLPQLESLAPDKWAC